MAAFPEQSIGNPNLIRFESEGAGLAVEAEVIIYEESMKILTPQGRDLLRKVVRSQAIALSLAMLVKENMSESDWEGYLKEILRVNRDTITELQTWGGPNFTTRLLGVDISDPVKVEPHLGPVAV